MAIQIMEQKVWFPCANSIFPVSSNITAGKGHQSFLPYSLDGPFLSPLFFLFSLASPFLPFSLEATLRPRPPHLFDLFISPTVPFPPSLFPAAMCQWSSPRHLYFRRQEITNFPNLGQNMPTGLQGKLSDF